jgi:hypothetical protein
MCEDAAGNKFTRDEDGFWHIQKRRKKGRFGNWAAEIQT